MRPFHTMTSRILMAAILVAGCNRSQERAPHEGRPQGTAELPALAEPLPESALRVEWGAANVPARMEPGSEVLVSVTFTNRGDRPWPDKKAADPSKHDGAHAVRLGYAWSPVSNPALPADRPPARADLLEPVKPGQSATLDISVRAPDAPGDYLLHFDLVQELLFWFSNRGAGTLTIPVRVEAGGGVKPAGTT